jgi:hypothetical protein
MGYILGRCSRGVGEREGRELIHVWDGFRDGEDDIVNLGGSRTFSHELRWVSSSNEEGRISSHGHRFWYQYEPYVLASYVRIFSAQTSALCGGVDLRSLDVDWVRSLL